MAQLLAAAEVFVHDTYLLVPVSMLALLLVAGIAALLWIACLLAGKRRDD